MLRYSQHLANRFNLKWFSAKNLCTTPDKLELREPVVEFVETNFVKLIGTAWDDSVHLPTGDHFCKVVQRCYNEDGQKFSISHILMLSQRFLHTNGIKSLKRGQAFNVNGYVRSIPFETSHGKIRNAISIVAHDMRLYEDTERPDQDVCIVMLTARIESRIWKTNALQMFNLKTHIPVRDEETGFTGESIEASHSVIVVDRKLQDYIQIHFNRGDYIFVEGYLNYRECETLEGKSRMCGNIIACHVERIEDYEETEKTEKTE